VKRGRAVRSARRAHISLFYAERNPEVGSSNLPPAISPWKNLNSAHFVHSLMGKSHLGTTALVLFSVLFITLLILIAKSPVFMGLRDSITGGNVLDTQRGANATGLAAGSSEGIAESEPVKNIQVQATIIPEEFSIAADALDVTIDADEVDIVMPSADIVLSLDDPMVFDDFSGTIRWENSMYTLEGKLSKYLHDKVQIRWKTSESVKIRVRDGSVSIPQIKLDTYQSIATGEVVIGEKAKFNPEKEPLTLENYRGSFISKVSEDAVTVELDGFADHFQMGSDDVLLSVG
jgi:hypothetical protein